MTDDNGSATQLAADAGTPDSANGNGDQGSNASAADPFSGLDTGTREWVGNKGYKSVADIAQAARNAESLIGRSVQLPGDDAKPEDIDQFMSKVTAKFRPEKADGYQLKPPDGLPDGMSIDDGFTTSFREAAHKAGLTAQQAAAMFGWTVDQSATATRASNEATAEAATAATKALEAKFGGASGSDQFKQGMQYANLAVKKLGGDALVSGLKDAGLLSDEGSILNAPLAIAFHEAGKALFTEDGLERGVGGSASGENPFDGPADKLNWTKIHMAIKQDRPNAIRLIRAANKNPADFGIRDAA